MVVSHNSSNECRSAGFNKNKYCDDDRDELCKDTKAGDPKYNINECHSCNSNAMKPPAMLQYLTPWFYPNDTCKIINQTAWPGLGPERRVFLPEYGFYVPSTLEYYAGVPKCEAREFQVPELNTVDEKRLKKWYHGSYTFNDPGASQSSLIGIYINSDFTELVPLTTWTGEGPALARNGEGGQVNITNPNNYYLPGGCIEQCSGRGFKFADLVPMEVDRTKSTGSRQIRCYCTQAVGKLSRKVTIQELKTQFSARCNKKPTPYEGRNVGAHSLFDKACLPGVRGSLWQTRRLKGIGGLTYDSQEGDCLLPLINSSGFKQIKGSFYGQPRNSITQWSGKWSTDQPIHDDDALPVKPWLSSGIAHSSLNEYGVATVYKTPLPFQEKSQHEGGSIMRYCDSTTAILSCPPKQSLKITAASYGRPAKSVGMHQYLCGGVSSCSKRTDVQKRVSQLCAGYQTCKFAIPAQLGVQDMPCKRRSNYVEVEYSCSTETPNIPIATFPRKPFGYETEKEVVALHS